MTRLIVKFGLPVVAILVALCLLMPMVGERTTAHLLAYNVTKPLERARRIFVTHLERGLSVNATMYPTGDYFIRVSPDGNGLIYRPGIEPNTRYALVNLHTWTTHLTPELPPNSAYVNVQWQADSQHIWLMVYDPNGTLTRSFVYDVPSDELNETADVPPTFVSIQREQIIIGTPIATDENGDPVWGVTLDDDSFPRLYDYASDEAITSFEIGRDLQPVSLSPDDEFLAAVLNRDRQLDLYLVPAWTGTPINLTQNGDRESLPVWSTDARYIAYISQADARRISTTELRIYDVNAGEVAYRLHFDAETMIDNNPLVWIP